MKVENKTAKPSFQENVEMIFEVLVTAFLFILLFALYRAFRNIPLSELREQIVIGYPKFIFAYIIIAVILSVFFMIILRKRIWLDFLLGTLAVLVLIGYVFYGENNFQTRIIAFFFSIILINYLFNVRKLGSNKDLSARGAITALAIIGVGSVVLLTCTAIVRHRIFLTSGFDLGVFDQMFFSMSQGKAPITTSPGYTINHMLEIHFSPVLYLFLPLYMIWKSPEALLFQQCVIVALAIIPIYKLARLYRFDRKYAVAFALIYLLHPGIFGGQTRDFHEVKMLPFFLLSFVYFFERNKKSLDFPTLFFLIMTLLVKEDASIYLLAYSLTGLFRDKVTQKKSFFVTLIAFFYFLIVGVFIVGTSDDFTYRFRSLLLGNENQNLFDLVKVLFTSPFSILSKVTTLEKLELYSLLLIPLAFIPLKGFLKLKNVFLLVPFVIFNILQDIEWQTIDSRYFYGTVALFMVIIFRELSTIMDKHNLRSWIALMMLSSILICVSVQSYKVNYFTEYQKNKDLYQSFEQDFALIPTEKTVSSSTHFYPHLSQRNEIYLFALRYPADYIALDLRDKILGPQPAVILDILEGDEPYGVIRYTPDYCILLEKGLQSEQTAPVIEALRAFDLERGSW